MTEVKPIINNNNAVKYKVKSGDSLSKIAKRNGIALSELLAANHIEDKDKNKINAGQVVTIPSKGKSMSQLLSNAIDESVEPFDTFIKTQKPQDDVLKSLLNAPVKEDKNAKVHLVKPGDTLSSIAQKNNITLDELMKANPKVKPLSLQINQKITIPTGKSAKSKNPFADNKQNVKYGKFENYGEYPRQTCKKFADKLGFKESSGDYKKVNRFGYLGKYQLGQSALVELGVYKQARGEKQSKNWKGKFTGKYGIKSKADILNNPKL